MLPWSHATTEELLGLGVDALSAGDRRGLTLLGEVLARECGPQFAETVTSALEAGTPLHAFDFLPVPNSRQPRGPAAAPAAPSAQAPAAEPPAAPVAVPEAPAAQALTGHAATPRPATAPPPLPVRAPSHHRTLSPGTPPPLPDSGYVTAIEVAAHFGVSVKAVYRWMATGRIRAERRPGGSYRIPADQFRA